jgi:predicted PurR-regulated permease PerM
MLAGMTEDRYRTFHAGRANFFLLAVITCFLIGAVLKVTAAVFLPFAIALLLAFVMSPAVNSLQRLKIPRFLSIFLIIIIIFAALWSLGIALFSSGEMLIRLYPKYENRLKEIYAAVSGIFDLPYDEQLSFFDNLWSQLGVRNKVRGMTLEFSNSFLAFLSGAFMVTLFVVFFLLESSFFMRKLDRAFENKRAGQMKKISVDLVRQISRYLSLKLIISLATGAVVALGLKFVGLEFAVLWGVIQFILNFIPNIGSIAAGFGATLFALLQFWPAPGPIVAVGLIMLAANIIIGSVLEPKIMGDNLGLSPVVVLMSLLIWGWLWGFAGMIIAVPMTVIVKIVCENIAVLEPVSILLSSRKAVTAKTTKKAAAPAAVTKESPAGND